MLDTEQEEPIKINHVLRYLRSRKTFLTESTESVNTEDDEVVNLCTSKFLILKNMHQFLVI